LHVFFRRTGIHLLLPMALLLPTTLATLPHLPKQRRQQWRRR
jgi:hypothetical protein